MSAKAGKRFHDEGGVITGPKFGFSVLSVGAELTVLVGGYGASDHAAGIERASDSEQSMGFSLSDPEMGDYFDVEIYTDPIYTTPVFRTVAGASRCPNEPGTAPREKFTLSVGDGVKRLQLFSNGETEVFFAVTINNLSPTKEDLGMFFYIDEKSNNFVPDSKDGGQVVVIMNDGVDSLNAGAVPSPLAYGKTTIPTRATLNFIAKPDITEYNGIKMIGYSKCEWDMGYPGIGIFHSPDTFETGAWEGGGGGGVAGRGRDGGLVVPACSHEGACVSVRNNNRRRSSKTRRPGGLLVARTRATL